MTTEERAQRIVDVLMHEWAEEGIDNDEWRRRLIAAIVDVADKATLREKERCKGHC